MHKQLVTAQVLEYDSQRDSQLASATQLAHLLQSESLRIVLAESCTLGSAAAALGVIPGISGQFCGSVVAYSDQAKTDWLGVSDVGIKLWSGVSAPVASLMARSVLLKTNEADYAASITGHLGPNAPDGLDGLVFVGLAWRDEGEVKLYRVIEEELIQRDRIPRIREASDLLLTKMSECILATHNTSPQCSRRANYDHC